MDFKKYNKMDDYLEAINRTYISYPKEKHIENNIILSTVVEGIVEEMCKDKLFNKLYGGMYFGGSYYDGLKVGNPDEYDIDLILKFPTATETEICNINEIEIYTSNKPGFVNVYLRNRKGFEKWCEFWQSYLDANKVLFWMQGVVQKAVNSFQRYQSWYKIEDPSYGDNYYVKVRSQGPAFTLIITKDIKKREIVMSVDLVPCFSFDRDQWPKNRYKQNPFSDNFNLTDFFVVPKCPKGPNYGSRYWRLSFQKQERYLIHDREHLKPALRLLKKMRDVMQHKQISSYFLKTIVLWEAEKKNNNFWFDHSLSYTFMHLLKEYQKCLESKRIPYFWNKNYNLLSAARGDINNINYRVRNMINDIERNVSQNPAVILKYMLTPDELVALYPQENSEGWCSLL